MAATPKACLWLLASTGAVALLGCSNYRFQEARRPGDGYDIRRLMADAKERGRLFESSENVFLYGRRTAFDLESAEVRPAAWTPDPAWGRARYVGGYRLDEYRYAGPLGLLWERESRTHFTVTGEPYETGMRTEALLGLWTARRSLVSTSHGPREESEQRFLFGFLPIWRTVIYGGDAAPREE